MIAAGHYAFIYADGFYMWHLKGLKSMNSNIYIYIYGNLTNHCQYGLIVVVQKKNKKNKGKLR